MLKGLKKNHFNCKLYNIHSYKKLKEKKLDLTLIEFDDAFEDYRNPICTKLAFIERHRLFRIIEKFLTKEINIYQFIAKCNGFFLDIGRLAPKLYSELDQLIGFQLLNIGTVELKIEANPTEWVLLYDLVEEFYYDIEERTDSGVKMVISSEFRVEFFL